MARLRDVALFATLDSRELALLARLAQDLEVEEGRVLIRRGDLGREFLVVREGTAAVTSDDELATLGPGDSFGEIALVENIHRTATVTATSPMRLVVLTAARFRPLRHTMPQIYEAVRLEISRRRGLSLVPRRR